MNDRPYAASSYLSVAIAKLFGTRDSLLGIEALRRFVEGEPLYRVHECVFGVLALELPIQGEPAEWLREVRQGRVTFEEWWNRSLELDAQLEAAATDDSIPPGADRDRIGSWMTGAHRRVWERETLI